MSNHNCLVPLSNENIYKELYFEGIWWLVAALAVYFLLSFNIYWIRRTTTWVVNTFSKCWYPWLFTPCFFYAVVMYTNGTVLLVADGDLIKK